MAIPFSGEEMTCVMCNKKQKSDPNVESNWTLITIGDVSHYVCPRHFEKCITKKQFQRAYDKVLRRILQNGGGML